MKSPLPCLIILFVMGLGAVASAQPFFSEPFDNNNAGWTFSPGSEWSIGSATSSTGHTVGFGDPSVDGSGTTAGGVAGVVIGGNASIAALHPFDYITSPALDITSLSTPVLTFDRYLNTDYLPYMDSVVEVWDGVAWQVLWSSGSLGLEDSAWTNMSFPLSSYVSTGFQVRFGFLIGDLGVFDMSQWNLDNVIIADLGFPEWEVNSSGASQDIDGVQAGDFTPAIVNLSAVSCLAGTTPATATINYSCSDSSGLWETVMNSAPIIPASGGAITLPGGMVNVSVFSGTLNYLNGGTALKFVAMPGSGFPGATSVSFSNPISIGTPLDISMQTVMTNSTSAVGYDLSQATELHVAVSAGAPSLPGPVFIDTSVTIDVTNAPSCWTTAGIPFYGTVFTEINVSSHGQVVFGGVNIDFSPTAAEAMSGLPFVGFWTDQNPGGGGNITISSSILDVVRVDFNGVPYSSGTGVNTYGIEFDALNGIVLLDGLSGIVPQTSTFGGGDDQFLGMSPGNLLGATDPGLTTFTAGGGSGSPALATDMLYDFLNSTTGAGRPATLLGGTNQIFFVPSATVAPNYDWTAN